MQKNQADPSNRTWTGNIRDQIQKWKDINVDDAHQSDLEKLQVQKEQIDEFNNSVTRKALIRYLTIVIDMSKASLK